MNHVSNVDQLFASAVVTAPTHICEEPLKLHAIFMAIPQLLKCPNPYLDNQTTIFNIHDSSHQFRYCVICRKHTKGYENETLQ